MKSFLTQANLVTLCKTSVLVVISVVCLSDSLHAQSLWERRNAWQLEMFKDPVAKRRGDLLMVVVNESTDVENRQQRIMDKTGNSQGSAVAGLDMGGLFGTGTGAADLNHQTSLRRAMTGDTQYRVERALLDRFTVSVTDVLPNRNLRIIGHRSINVDGDVRMLQLSGVVRFVDVLPNNTIPSQMIGDLHIRFVGNGPEQSFNNQGPVARRINRWWPF